MARILWQLSAVGLEGQTRAAPRLDEVTLEIPAGITAVMGYSGAGKTSLLNLLVGFERPARGVCHFRADNSRERLALFWSPQDGGLWPHLTAREHLQRVGGNDELLNQFDLSHRASAFPGELSQGEKSRLAVARALASRAAVLVMDEPLAHVDGQRVGRYWQVILKQIADAGSSLVFATHVPRMVLAHAQRVIYLDRGRALYHGEVADLYWRPPTPQLARGLGECNWFEPHETGPWLGAPGDQSRALRPEQVTLVPDDAGPTVVESSLFQGDIAEVTLRHDTAGQRLVYHRPTSANGLHAGDRVSLKLLLLVVLIFMLGGCDGGNEPALNVREVRIWRMPPDDRALPAPRSVNRGPDGTLIVLDTAGRVLFFGPDGELVRQHRMPTNEAGNPEGVCLLHDGRIAVADTHYSRVVIFDDQGQVQSMFGQRGEGPGAFIYPASIVQDDDGNLYVAEYGGNDRVQKFTSDGEFILQFGKVGAGPGEFQRACGLAHHQGVLYVTDAINNRIQRFDRDGNFLGVLGGTAPAALHYPYSACVGNDHDLYVIEYGAGRITRLGLDGRLLGRFGAAGRGIGQFSTPWGIGIPAADRHGVIVADTGNRRLVELEF